MAIAMISDEFLIVFFSIRKISKDDRALINVLRREKNWSNNVCWERFPGRIRPGQARTGCWRKLIPLINYYSVTERLKDSGRARSFRTWNFEKHRTCGGAHLQSLKCSAHLQKSVRNSKGDGHFTVVCLAHCKAWSSAEICKRLSELLSFDKWRHFIFQSCF